VAGAVFSGFAMVQSLLLITRKLLNLEDYITIGHIEAMNKVIVLTGSIVGCAYLSELFVAWYSQNTYEWWAFRQNRVNIFSPYGWAYYGMIFCNVVSPQLLWVRKLRRNVMFTFFLAVLVNVGMWFERFVIIFTSIYRDYLPSSWTTYYSPSIWEIGFYLGTFGLFFVCYLLFAKYFPVVAAAEIKAILKLSGESYKDKMTSMELMNSDKFYAEEVEPDHAH
jgi:molybdopterin-containing oxidoreductase family membrane subunit